MERKEKNGSTAIITDQAGMPSNKNAEAAVLGAMLWDNSIIPDVGVTLPEPAFHDRKNRTVYNAIRDAWESDGIANQTNVTIHLLEAGKLDGVGQSYVAELVGDTATSANWQSYAKTLIEHQNRRKMIVLSQKLETLGKAGDTENGLALVRDYLDQAAIDTSQVDWDDMPTVAEFVKSGGETVEYLLDGLIVENSATILASDPGAGKSMWAFGLAFSIATGEPFLGREVKPGKVLYFDYEMPGNMLRWRLGAFARGIGLDINTVDNFRIRPFATNVLSTEAGINDLAARVGAFKPNLIVFDTMRRAMGELKESTSDDMSKIFQANNYIKARTGHDFSVLYLHHTVKNPEAKGLERLRGSGDLAGQVDLVLIADTFSDGRITIESVKKRHGDPFRETHKMVWTKTDVKIEPANRGIQFNGEPELDPDNLIRR